MGTVVKRRKFEWGAVLLVLGLIVVMPILAAFNVLVGPLSVLPYVGIAAIVVFFALPLTWLVQLAWLSAAVLAGLIEYFAHFSQSYWLPYLMGLLFGLRAVVERMRPVPFAARLEARGAAEHAGLPQAAVGVQLISAFALMYLAVGVFSTVVALPPLGQVFVAAKNYWFMWGMLLLVLWCPLPEKTIRLFWTLLIVVACIQWPFTAYQRLVVAARRTDAAAWDAVVGTFGGDPMFGGNSAAMALTSCVAVAALFWRVRERQIRPLTALLGVGLSLLPIAMAEVKAAFIWLTIVFLMLFVQQVVKQPVRAVLTLAFGAVVLAGVGMVYKASMYESQGGQDLAQIYDKQIKYAFDPNEFRAEYGRLGRVAALSFWRQHHDAAADSLHVLIGHGLGSSRGASLLGMGEVARKYTVSLDTTAASTLLWDTGVLGLTAFLAMLGIGAVAGMRQSRNRELSPQQRETAFLAGTWLAMCSLGVFYNRDAIDTAVVQFLIYFSLGHVLLIQRRTPAARGAGQPNRVGGRGAWVSRS